MGKNMTKKRKGQKRHGTAQVRKALISTAGFLALLLVGVIVLIGVMKTNRNTAADVQNEWYVQEGYVEVAAPPAEVHTAENFASMGDDAVTLPENIPTPTATPLITSTPVVTSTPLVTQEPVQKNTLTITAAGDITLGGNVPTGGDQPFARSVEKNGFDFFLEKVRPVFEADDLTIVNLEGPLTTSNKKRSGRPFNFKGDPAYVNILSGSSVEICTLANNHILDYGTEGVQETAQVLTNAGIAYSGYSESYTTTINGIRVTSMAFDEWNYSVKKMLKEIAEARKNCDVLIVSMHWGRELQYTATSEQKTLGHKVVDAGADLVLGSHSHVYGGVEKYKDKYIVYGLGNFCFGGNTNPKDKRCIMFQQTFEMADDGTVHDAGINIIPAAISSVTNKNNFQPMVLPVEQGAKLLKAVAKLSKGFSMADTLWMPTSYLYESGLVTLDIAQGAEEEDELAVSADDEEAAADVEGGEDSGEYIDVEGLFGA